MGLTVASYNVCEQVNIGIFKVSTSGPAVVGQSAGDPCNNCGEYGDVGSTTSTGSMSITIPYSSLIYAPENIWIAVMGEIASFCASSPGTLTFTFYNSSGNEIGSYSFTVSSGSSAQAYYIISSPVPSGTDTITVTTSAEAVSCGSQTIPYTQIWVTDVYFYSQPPVYYIEPLYFYNQTLTYSISLNITTSDYLALWVMSGGSSSLTSYSACVVTSNGTFCANTQFFSGESSISAFQVTGNANNTYQVTWSQELALIFVNSSCGLDNIFLFEVTGYNNILNPSEYTFTIQTPFNGSVSKTYTLLIPVGYFKLLPSYSLSCSTSPCTSGFTTFTITVDIQTSSGVVVASQQVDVLSGQTFTTFNLEDYYGGQTLDVVITLNIDATLSQTVTLTMNFEYEVLAQT
jgi:hypothetical protein